MKSTKLALVAALGLALTFTLSCSGGSGGGGEGGNWPGGDGSSSSGGGTFPRSSSGSEQGGSFNVNSQIYNENGTLYTGNGIIEATSGVTYYSDKGYEWDHLNAGNVTNGIVNLNLPQTIPNEYLRDFLGEENQRSCTSYPENIKMFGGGFVLTNSNKDYIGSLSTQFDDEQIFELFTYVYFTKAGKITCNLQGEKGGGWKEISNIDAKNGWNKLYKRSYSKDGVSIEEISTNNILTKEKEMKWVIEQ